ncbi:MAG TPA: GAF domain-containing protein [Labilithrix sp.]|nr:GAF domain-containing protein [Labilithrix sp.]
MIATCDADGVPNITYLSQIFLLEDDRVALSCQFFNKTKKNVLVNPVATTQIYDPLTFDAYRVVIKYSHEEREGKLFEGMSRRIDAIATHSGMAGVFRLLSADVYDVVSVENVAGFKRPGDLPSVPQQPSAVQYRSEMSGLQHVSQRISRARDLEELYACTVEALEEGLGFENSMILLPDETGSRLYAIAGRGYGESGVGAEVGLGEGLIGTVARERCILRVAGVGAELRYGRAIRTSVQRATGLRGLRPEIPLPGLVDAQSQMALPLVANDRLVGVIAVESKKTAAFQEWHEAFLDIIANQIASAIENMTLREKDEKDEEPAVPLPPRSEPAPPSKCEAPALKLRFFKSDDCVFAADEYLVRNVPGRILWKILRELTARGRTEFTNREFRLDPALGLPAIRDNLESRLVLLRKRLEQKCPQIALVPTARGRFRVDVTAPLELEESA